MYFTSFHKGIFNAIGNKEIRCIQTFFKKYIVEYCDKDTVPRVKIFNNKTLNLGELAYLIRKNNEEEVYNQYLEFFYILEFLEKENLISLVSNKNPIEFIPIYYKSETNESIEFDDLWIEIVKYYKMKIIVRKGFEKFKKLGLQTLEDYKEEKRQSMELFLKWFAAFIAFSGIVFTVIINFDKFIKLFK